MTTPTLLVIGGGLAGLSTGVYARENGFDVTIVEHNLALGGVCTAWQRGPYLVDGCIHWLTGGPFSRIYEELGIFPAVRERPLKEFVTYRHARDGWSATLSRDLQQSADSLSAIAPEDADEVAQMMDGARHVANVQPPIAHAPEIAAVRDQLLGLWNLRHDVGALVHFRGTVGTWAAHHVRSPRLRALLLRVMAPDVPMMFLLMVLGYLERGWLSRPVGGTAAFRDALVDRYASLGGKAVVNTTVDEVVVSGDRAVGVRLADGTMMDTDLVVSTSSAPETVFRLLAGRYGADQWKARMDEWRMFQPIVLASFGVEKTFEHEPPTLLVDAIEPLDVGGVRNEHLYLRLYNEDAAFAPPGHTVVQAMLGTDYNWWATRGTGYQYEKDRAGEQIAAAIDRHLPGVKAGVRMTDIATPLTYWRSARSWRGAFEGWMPSSNVFTHVAKTLPRLRNFYMAGQWVEPGGGVPMATMSGRHVVEIICAAEGRPFEAPLTAVAPSG